MELARITWDGRVTTVTLPEGVRLRGDAVRVRQDGDRIVLEPALPPAPSREDVHRWLGGLRGGYSEEAARYALEEEPPLPDRPDDRSPFD